MNNYAKCYKCISLWGSYKHKCEYSNIINNSHVGNRGIVDNGESSITTTIINKCCLLKNVANNIGYLFYAVSGSTMEVRECTIQSRYSIYGAVTTSYSNTVAESECASISNCGSIICNKDENKSKIVQCKVITMIASHQQALVTK
jgi:hypothetical protein